LGALDDHNATCPFCGKAELRASIEERYRHVPLQADGYSTIDGEQTDSEIHQIVCNNCNKEVSVWHYTGHGPGGDPCDCVEHAAALEQKQRAALFEMEVADALEQGREAAGV